MKHIATLFAGLLIASTAGAGDVYVTTDAKGQKIYTDTPQTVPARKLDVHSQSTDPATAAKENPSAPERDGQQQKASSGAQVQRAAQAGADDRAVKCTEARQRYETLTNSLGAYTLGPNGEQNYLTAEQMSEERVKAKQFLDKFCADQ
jgi:hypothetical protein